jgi:hypothetical protein
MLLLLCAPLCVPEHQVFDIFLNPNYPPPATFTPGVPLVVQPVMTVISKGGNPVAGRVVIAFASQSPFLEVDPHVTKGATLSNSAGADLEGHDFQGQRVATLTNAVSRPSDANGVVVFDGLTITGTSSPFVYIGFYCEGKSHGAARLLFCAGGPLWEALLNTHTHHTHTRTHRVLPLPARLRCVLVPGEQQQPVLYRPGARGSSESQPCGGHPSGVCSGSRGHHHPALLLCD